MSENMETSMNEQPEKWQIWNGISEVAAEEQKTWLETLPPWRAPSKDKSSSLVKNSEKALSDQGKRRGKCFRGEGDRLIERVNMALWLRRPILVQGDPGIGKSSLAYSLAWSLGLAEVLHWEIGSRTTLQDGLYRYDAVDHLRDSQVGEGLKKIEEFIQLGPLGTALVGQMCGERKRLLPRVLLIDEIDKSDYDLPNDLLHVLEGAEFGIRELEREDKGSNKSEAPKVSGYQKDGQIKVSGGEVVSNIHPIVVMTSNDERTFPEAFRRRCVEVTLTMPTGEKLRDLVAQHFEDSVLEPPAREELSGRPDHVLQELFMEIQGMAPEQARNILQKDG